jgi:hypothetical protein
MRYLKKTVSSLFISIIVVSVFRMPLGESCKDIIIAPDATADNCSLLLKIRDPSRDGLQVLCRVPKGTEYVYHYPWTGKPWEFSVTHTFLGVATQGDTLPNIVKAGMVLTDAGLAFGDADTLSGWVNPTKNAWDDFDWIRYACQTADDENQAVTLLTTEAVKQLHATGVAENLFLIGTHRSLLIEADAFQFAIKDVSDILVMSNYPKDLWRTQLFRSLPIALSFDTLKETQVRQGSIVHLGSLCGVRILQIHPSSITAQVFPSFAFHQSGQDKEIEIALGERTTIGPYSVQLLEIQGNQAKITVCTSVYAWEREVRSHLEPSIGNITIQDVIAVSRLHSEDLNGLRPMCEDQNTNEAAMIFSIPPEYASLLGSAWFSANHPCSSVYVPVHICDDDFYDAYETGEAAALSLELLQKYGHGNLTPLCESVETVFLLENDINEYLAYHMILNGSNITGFLTELDRAMQEQAFLTEQLWLTSPKSLQGIITTLWTKNYTNSLQRMRQATTSLKFIPESELVVHTIQQIIHSIMTTEDIRSTIPVH